MASNPVSANPLKKYLIPGVIALVLLVLGGYFLLGLLSNGNKPNGPSVGASPAVGTSSEVTPGSSGSTATSTDLDKLMAEAKAAYQKEQYVDPEGANAVELYLRVLELDPNNRVAQEALLEVMPYATDRADQYISERNIPQAERALALLKKADPNSVILTSLAGKIEQIKRIQASKDADALALQEVQQQQAAQAAARAAASAPEEPTAAPTPVAETPVAESTPTRPATPPPTVASTTPTPSVTAQTAPESRNFQLVRKVDPSYPQRAMRQRIEGWVELSFVVGVNGDVSNVQVVDSQPRREFDREAVRALSQWKFRPRLENGKTVAATARQRLEFKLGN